MMESSLGGAEAVSSLFQLYRILYFVRAKGGARAPCAPPGYTTGSQVLLILRNPDTLLLLTALVAGLTSKSLTKVHTSLMMLSCA